MSVDWWLLLTFQLYFNLWIYEGLWEDQGSQYSTWLAYTGYIVYCNGNCLCQHSTFTFGQTHRPVGNNRRKNRTLLKQIEQETRTMACIKYSPKSTNICVQYLNACWWFSAELFQTSYFLNYTNPQEIWQCLY